MTPREPAGRPRLVLVGMMGAGKTAVGRAVAARLGWPYLDNDDLVRALTGEEAPAIAVARGIDALHRVEIAALEEALRRPGPLVASAAGFAVTDGPAARHLRDDAVVAWLRARPETLRLRVGDGSGRRHDARSEAWLAGTAAERSAAFAAVADVVVDVDDRSVDEVADAVLDALERAAGRFGDPR